MYYSTPFIYKELSIRARRMIPILAREIVE